MTEDSRLTPLLKKVENIRQYELSGRTGLTDPGLAKQQYPSIPAQQIPGNQGRLSLEVCWRIELVHLPPLFWA